MKIKIIAIAFLLLPTLCFAQADMLTYQPPSKIEKKVIDTKFVAVGAYLVAMTIFDVETTFSAVRNGAHEANPIMKPFVNSGRPVTYAIEFAIDAAILFLAYELKKSKNPNLNKTWWVVPMISGTAHGVCAGLNLRYAW
jgi:hypothetical protein